MKLPDIGQLKYVKETTPTTEEYSEPIINRFSRFPREPTNIQKYSRSGPSMQISILSKKKPKQISPSSFYMDGF